MKNHKIQNLLARPLALLCCAALLASCYSEDEMDGCFPAAPKGGKATVRIGVTAERSGSAPSVKAGSDQNAQSGEYIHQLCVLIVDNTTNTLEWKFLSDGSSDPAFAAGSDAEDGNLENWTSEPIEITTGQKTIYAFANWAGVNNTQWNTLIGLEKDEKLTTTLSSIVIADPAATISLGTEPYHYIPMSGSIAATVTANTGTISLPVDRLVSRVRLSLQLPEGVTLGQGASLEFAGCAANVGLFRKLTDDTEAGAHDAYSFPIATAGGSTGAQTLTVPDFYVNETMLSQPFTVTLHTGNTTGAGIVDYTAQTALTDLPRNSIYPLTLSLSDTELGITAQAWLSPIGALPVEIAVEADAATYSVTGICVGAQFDFTIGSITHGQQQYTPTSVVWTLPAGQEGISLDGGATAVTDETVSGYISADDRYIGDDRTLQVQVTWQEGGKTYERVFNVVITDLLDMFDVTEKRSSASARRILTRSLSDWLKPETLILFTKK